MGKKNLRKPDEVAEREEIDELEAAEFQKELMALKGIQKLQKSKAKKAMGKGKEKEKEKDAKVDVEGTDNEEADIEGVEEDEEEDDEEDEDEEVQVEVQSKSQAQEMLEKIKELNPQKVPWIERMDVVSSKPIIVENVDDDFKRELAL